MVYYRKYRPQIIDDLDNSHVRETLYSVLQNLSTHAFLFTGPKGLGKTSTARIIAKVVNCEKRNQESGIRNQENKKIKSSKTHDSSFMLHNSSDIEPCNKCQQCESITNGTNLDVLEIDAASNRGIDEIRDLKEKIRLSPVAAKMKVYIIDEVHMLTNEAFNALLKTLEEPPSHAMFVLCTTEPHKIPATIISRCFHLNFKPATEEELVRSFMRIVKAEQLDIDQDALKYIANLSERGFRDGVKILEEIVALAGGKKITKELIEGKYQVASSMYYVSSIMESLNKKDVKRSLSIVSEIVDKGIDVKDFLAKTMEVLHGILLSQMEIHNTKYPIHTTAFSTDEIRVLFELLSKAYLDSKYTVLPQLPLELAVIEYCQNDKDLSDSNAGQRVENREEDKKKIEDGSVTVSSLRKQVGTIKKVQALYGSAKQTSDEKNIQPTIKTSTVELMHAAPNGEITKEWLDHFWSNLISEIKNYNHTIAGVLRGCSIKIFDKEVLVIETGYKFHKEKLSESKTLEELEKVCKLLTGKNVKVRVELKT